MSNVLGGNKISKSWSLKHHHSLPSLQIALGGRVGWGENEMYLQRPLRGHSSHSHESSWEHVYKESCGQLRKATFAHFES